MIHFGGHTAHQLLILHATGFHAAAYAPLATALTAHFDCFGMDLLGHGAAADGVTAADITLPNLVQQLINEVDKHSLRGCYCFGHSGGAAVAVLASCKSPGLFAAIFCFEAVLATPTTHDYMQQEAAAGRLRLAGDVLAALARSRRRVFPSAAQAMQVLSSKPPFSAMDQAALQQYVVHGMKPVPPPPQQQQQQQQQQMVQLICSPAVEAAWYEALSPPPAVITQAANCPIAFAYAAEVDNSCQMTIRDHTAVQAWLQQQQQQQQQQQKTDKSSPGRQAGGLHGVLRVLNMELAAAVPAAAPYKVQGVSHFGPLEQPQLVADSCLDFFLQHPQQESGRMQHAKQHLTMAVQQVQQEQDTARSSPCTNPSQQTHQAQHSKL
jgi:pimeloyl-ACP methyl ester carboxylesterase